jgi:acyl-CoA synthetase (AMP-forming)/AMP-acid ligase II
MSPGPLAKAILERAAATPDLAAVTIAELDGESLSYGNLVERAEAASGALSKTSGPLLISCEDHRNSAVGLLAALMSRRTLVPVFSPGGFQDHRDPGRLPGVSRTSGTSTIITDASFTPHTPSDRRTASGQLLSVLHLGTDASRSSGARSSDSFGPAVVQFSSGTTGSVRGAALSEEAIAANIQAIGETLDMWPGTVSVTWLPMYHDMGLFGGLVAPLARGATAVALRPETFIAHPVDWLRAVSRYRGEISAAPNFAYQRCADRVANADTAGLDLSSWGVAINGAEPVRASTMERFSAKFHNVGFQRSAFRPAYGMSESTLLISVAAGRENPTDDEVSCGPAVPGTEIRISSNDHLTSSSGEIEIRSESLASSYWIHSDAGRVEDPLTDSDGWFRTGDVGYLRGDELHVTGRIDCVLSIRGRQISAEQLENQLYEAIPEISVCRASIGTTASLVIEFEAQRERAVNENQVRRAVEALTAVGDVEVRALQRGSIARTSSGKVRRAG